MNYPQQQQESRLHQRKTSHKPYDWLIVYILSNSTWLTNCVCFIWLCGEAALQWVEEQGEKSSETIPKTHLRTFIRDLNETRFFINCEIASTLISNVYWADQKIIRYFITNVRFLLLCSTINKIKFLVALPFFGEGGHWLIKPVQS